MASVAQHPVSYDTSPRDLLHQLSVLCYILTVSVLVQDDEAGESDDDEVPEEDMAEVDQQIREAEVVAAEAEEAAAVQEQIRRIRAEEEEFETFDLKIIHRRNRCGHEVARFC